MNETKICYLMELTFNGGQLFAGKLTLQKASYT